MFYPVFNFTCHDGYLYPDGSKSKTYAVCGSYWNQYQNCVEVINNNTVPPQAVTSPDEAATQAMTSSEEAATQAVTSSEEAATQAVTSSEETATQAIVSSEEDFTSAAEEPNELTPVPVTVPAGNNLGKSQKT